jgi:hypothetical protein
MGGAGGGGVALRGEVLERLDDHDDVQNVSANFNISDEVMAELSAAS